MAKIGTTNPNEAAVDDLYNEMLLKYVEHFVKGGASIAEYQEVIYMMDMVDPEHAEEDRYTIAKILWRHFRIYLGE